MELQSVVPSLPAQAIKDELIRSNGNKATSAQVLLDIVEVRKVVPHVSIEDAKRELLRLQGDKQGVIAALASQGPPAQHGALSGYPGASAKPVALPGYPGAGGKPMPVAQATPAAKPPAKLAVAQAVPAPVGGPKLPNATSWVSAPVVNEPPPPLTGVRKALLIGINYFGTSAELRGCINDVHAMKRVLIDSGWRDTPETMMILTDDSRRPGSMPTKANILRGMEWLTRGAQPGDVLFFHYSGHGAQQLDPDFAEEDGMDETICPCDMTRAGQITDNQISKLLVESLPSGCRLTAVMDCCHSGTGMDLPFTLHGHRWQEDDNPHFTLGDVVMFSGCEDHATSADSSGYGKAGGAMTSAFVKVMQQGRGRLTYPALMRELDVAMRRGGFSQRPQLTSSQAFDTNRPFLLDDIHPNRNRMIGRQFRVRHKHPRRDFGNTGLGDMLMAGAAGYVALALAPDLIRGAAWGAESLVGGAGALFSGAEDGVEGAMKGIGDMFGGLFGGGE